ncbi:MAG: phosphoenolpyruvate--protein phosphotransferase [Firmicutes bacterium]|nr:phosphoenolpyruvate--protein phosphotransferase [Bacillota bacterium]
MIELSGRSVCGGVTFGKISIFSRNGRTVKRTHIQSAEEEIGRFLSARDSAVSELEVLYEKARVEIGEAQAQIFAIHQMMLEDEDYNDSVKNIISAQMVNAETAVLATSDNFARMFSETEDAYMQERAADVKDVSDRVINILSGGGETKIVTEQTIIVADDLAPSETIQMDKEKILAFVMENGSSTSHTAILARSMNIPALIGTKGVLNPEFNGKAAAVDGYNGKIYIEPDEKTAEMLKKKKQEKELQRELLKKLKDKPTVTKRGRKINLYANIGTPEDLGSVLLNDAEGIGLFRSEFLYLKSDDFPSEDVQFQAYRRVAEAMGDKPVIIRTLDIGADKKIGYFNIAEEENPAMGMRAIRICLERPTIFKTQLRAILRASAFGNIMIMLPMITSVDEVERSKTLIDEVKSELENSGIPYNRSIEVGIMIETPAAAVISDLLAEKVDFFSIGTNDLTQYVLAMDRQNSGISAMLDTHHEAILRLIKTVVDNSHKKGIWTGICGELGADIELLPRFIELGIDELSVSPSRILEIRSAVRESE